MSSLAPGKAFGPRTTPPLAGARTEEKASKAMINELRRSDVMGTIPYMMGTAKPKFLAIIEPKFLEGHYVNKH